jgi:nicotinate-nucleotide adenylyltransferase
MKKQRQKLRIGVYAGAFDPVHAGHVAFALQAKKAARLDQIIFMPERRPRYKPSVEHYAHRIAMLKAALSPHADLAVMEVVDRHFTVRRTLPMLQALYPGAQLVLLMGSDTVQTVPDWKYSERLLRVCELVVGVRSDHQREVVERAVSEWTSTPQSLVVFDSLAPDVSSSRVRSALRVNQYTTGLLSSVRRYAYQEWLYVSPGHYLLEGPKST